MRHHWQFRRNTLLEYAINIQSLEGLAKMLYFISGRTWGDLS